MDFTEAPTAIADRYPYLFVVRDLASGYQLLWQPVEVESAQEAMFQLAQLFALHGAPLVLKCDNGSAFLAATTKALLVSVGGIMLYSPCTPSRNDCR